MVGNLRYNLNEFLHGNLFKISISRMLAITGERLAFPFLSLYILELGGSTRTIATISSIGSIASVLVVPIGGYIADRKGRVTLLGLGTLAYSVCSIFFIFAQNWVFLAIGIFIQMLFRIYMPALDAILADSTTMESRGRAYAFSDAISAFPSIFAPIIIGFIAKQYSASFAVKIGFGCLFLLGIAAAIIRLKLKETLISSEERIKIKEIPIIIVDSYKKILTLLKESMFNLRIIIIVSLFLSVINCASGPYWIVYSKEILGLNPAEWGIIISVGAFLRAILLVPAGYIVDKIGVKRIILMSLIPLPFLSILFTLSNSFLSALLIMSLITMFNILLAPASSALFANSTQINSRGSSVAAIGRGRIGLIFNTGVLSSATLLLPTKLLGYQIGDILYQTNPAYPWYFLSLGLFLIIIIIWKFLSEK